MHNVIVFRSRGAMKFVTFLAIFGCLFVLTAVPSTVQAQGAFVTRCAQILLSYVGKPLTKGAMEAAGGAVAKYLLDRGSTSISQADIQQLQHAGLTECEVRQQLEAIYSAYSAGGQPNVARSFSAQ